MKFTELIKIVLLLDGRIIDQNRGPQDEYIELICGDETLSWMQRGVCPLPQRADPRRTEFIRPRATGSGEAHGAAYRRGRSATADSAEVTRGALSRDKMAAQYDVKESPWNSSAQPVTPRWRCRVNRRTVRTVIKPLPSSHAAPSAISRWKC